MQGETADRILKTAHHLMADRGYAAFSYADIAETVEIRKASIHHHFPTKAGLAVAVLKEHRENLLAAIETLDEKIENPLGRLQAYLKHWEGCIRGNTQPFCVAAMLAAELPGLPPEVRAEVERHFETLSGWIERVLEAGVKKRVIKLQNSAATEAQLLMAVVHGAMLSARAYGTCDVFSAVTSSAMQRISVTKS
jgi:TetR/AcrR family transcriptional regulator, transcriptional repressor for nem operon